MRSRAASVVILLVVLALLAACAVPAPAPAAPAAEPAKAAAAEPTKAPEAQPAEQKIFKLGIEAPFTGPNARTGEEMKDGAIMAFDKINWTIGDYKIVPVYIDDESDAEKGTRAYEAAATRDNIQAGILGWHSWVTVAQMEVTAKYKIPHFFSSGATGVVNEKYKSDPTKYTYWMAKGWPTPIKLTSAYVTALEEAIAKGNWKPEAKKVAFYGNDTDWCREFAKGMKEQFEKVGWTVVGEEYVPVGETDFYPLLTKLKASGATLLAGTFSDSAGVTTLIKQTKEVGITAMIISDSLGWTGEWYKMTGDASNYILDQIPQWTTPEAKQFVTDFKAKFGIEPGPSAAGLSYDHANVFIAMAQEIVKQGGELNKETIYKFGQEQLMTGKWSYKGGILMKEYKYTPETAPDPVVDGDHYVFPVIQYMDGNSIIVWPESWKTGDLKAKP